MAQVNGNPQNCALVQSSDNVVVNMIVADPTVDPAPEGHVIVALPADSPVSFGWVRNPADGTFTNPNPPVAGA